MESFAMVVSVGVGAVVVLALAIAVIVAPWRDKTPALLFNPSDRRVMVPVTVPELRMLALIHTDVQRRMELYGVIEMERRASFEADKRADGR